MPVWSAVYGGKRGAPSWLSDDREVRNWMRAFIERSIAEEMFRRSVREALPLCGNRYRFSFGNAACKADADTEKEVRRA